jgi:hypothetical protein
MSKAAAIHAAIRLQLAADGKSVADLRYRLGTTPANEAGNTADIAAVYSLQQIRGFLANVAFRLRADTPALVFNWSTVDANQCLQDPLWVIEQNIAEQTTELGSPAETEKK